MLDVFLPVDRRRWIAVLLKMDEHLELISTREARNDSLPMLIGSSHEVIGDADIKRAARNIRDDINEILSHDGSHHGLPGQARQ